MWYILITVFYDILMVALLYKIGHIYGGTAVLSLKKDIASDQAFIKSAFKTYLIWGAIQQVIVILIYSALKYLLNMPDMTCVLLSSIIFMILHYPNIVLMFAVFGMELFLLIAFTQVGYSFILLMAFTHGLLATCLLQFFPSDFTKEFRVLWSFWDRYLKKK